MDWFWLILFGSLGVAVATYPVLAAPRGLPMGAWAKRPYIPVAGMALCVLTVVTAFIHIAWWASPIVLIGGIWGGGVVFAILRQWAQMVGIVGTFAGLVVIPLWLVGSMFD